MRDWRTSTWILVVSATFTITTWTGFFIWIAVSAAISHTPTIEQIMPLASAWVNCLAVVVPVCSFIVADRAAEILCVRLAGSKFPYRTSTAILFVSGVTFIALVQPMLNYIPKLTRGWLVLLWACFQFRVLRMLKPNKETTS